MGGEVSRGPAVGLKEVGRPSRWAITSWEALPQGCEGSAGASGGLGRVWKPTRRSGRV